MLVNDPTLSDVEEKVAEATSADPDRARELLEEAQEDIEELREDPDVDQSLLNELETEIEQRQLELDEREEYGGSYGAAMEPDDEDAI